MRISLAGKDSNKSLSQAGLTLIELLVGMAVVSIILAIVVGGVRDLFEAEMKSSAYRLGSTIRYLYNKAVTERLYLRIVYDLEEDKYHIESTTEPFVISPEEMLAKGAVPEEGAVIPEEGVGDEDAALPQETFGAEETYLLKKVTLGAGIIFKDIQVSYLDDKVEEGFAYTYFFPNGYATPTMINLTDEEEEEGTYSLKIFPLSGKVQIRSEYRELATE